MSENEGRDIVHPGWVTSLYDGDRHYITFNMLCSLYGLNPRTAVLKKDYMAVYPNDRHWHPRQDGKYKRVDGDLLA